MGRVVITGMGVICALGSTREETVAGTVAGQAGISRLDGEYLGVLEGVYGGAAPVTAGKDIAWGDRACMLAFEAVEECITHAAIDFSAFDPYRVGVCFGTTNGNVDLLEKWFENPQRSYDDPSMVVHIGSNLLDHIAFKHGLRGPRAVFASACAASAQAVGFAFDSILAGNSDVMLVGGADCFVKTTVSGFAAMRALAGDYSSPFSSRIGLTLGEGAGFLALESENSAVKRGAKIHGYVLGYGFGGDAHHVTAPDSTGQGTMKCMRQALSRAAIRAAEVDFICAHGTGTKANDATESKAIEEVFKGSSQLQVTSTKGALGHTLGASGIIQAIQCLGSQDQERIPPITNFKDKRSGCNLNYVTNAAFSGKTNYFMSNSLAFGGNNVSILYGKKDQRKKAPVQQIMEPIVVTGYGCVSPTFADPEEFFGIIQQKRKVVKETLTVFEKFVIPNKAFRAYRKQPAIAQMSVHVAEMALRRAGYSLDVPSAVGVMWGASPQFLQAFEDFYQEIVDYDNSAASPLLFPHVMPNSLPGAASIALKLRGINTTFVGAISSYSALEYAYQCINTGQSEAVVIGSCDHMASMVREHLKLRGYGQYSEGGAAVIVEKKSKALARGATILAELSGFASGSKVDGDPARQALRHSIDLTLQRTSSSLDSIEQHIHSEELGKEPVADFAMRDLQKISSQEYVGHLDCTTPLLNLILAVKMIEAGTSKTILTAECLDKTNGSFIAAKVSK